MNELLDSINSKTAVDFLQKKKNRPTSLYSKHIAEDWNKETRVRSFFSARVAKAELLDSFRYRCKQMVEGSISKSQARSMIKNFLDTDGASMLSELGFGGTDVSDSLAELGSTRRINLILEENTRQAYAVGEYKQLLQDKDLSPYLEYHTLEDSKVRRSHAVLDGLVYKVDDPIWGTIYPPNDFSCRCYVRELDRDEVKGRNISETMPKGVDEENPLSKSGYGFDVTKGMDTALGAKENWTDELKRKYRGDVIPFMNSRKKFLEQRKVFWGKQGLEAKTEAQKILCSDTVADIGSKVAYIKNYTKKIEVVKSHLCCIPCL